MDAGDFIAAKKRRASSRGLVRAAPDFMTETMPAPSSLQAVTKEVLIDGRLLKKQSVVVNSQAFSFSRGRLKVASLEEEWFEDVADPQSAIGGLRRCTPVPDLLTFWQRIPDTEPHHPFHLGWESLAVLPIVTYENWWNKQVKGTTRNMVRKSQKVGVEVREAEFDEAFIHGLVEIFNETPVRQGRPFWHYGKDFAMVKKELSADLERSIFVAAYYKEELIGFIKFFVTDRYAMTLLILDKHAHRDKAPMNAMIAKVVEICAEKKIPFFTYTIWRRGDHGHFQKSNGFEKIPVPEYFVPLSLVGRLALAIGLHKGLKGALPEPMIVWLLGLRSAWYDFKYRRRHPIEPGNQSVSVSSV